MYKKLLAYLTIFFIIIFFAVILDQNAQKSPLYEGLPTVPCLDYTKKIVENFTFNINIKINGKNIALDPKIGHDYGQCLHEIYVKDSSGKVIVSENEKTIFTLGNFFDVWHKTFNQNQIFNYFANPNHTLNVYVNGEKATGDLRNIPLTKDENLQIIYN